MLVYLCGGDDVCARVRSQRQVGLGKRCVYACLSGGGDDDVWEILEKEYQGALELRLAMCMGVMVSVNANVGLVWGMVIV